VPADVIIDDFIALAQGSPAHANRIVRRILLLLLKMDETFHPNDSSEPTPKEGHRKIISLKKVLKGDACWSTVKVVLGYCG
jgi:hypothetical protein